MASQRNLVVLMACLALASGCGRRTPPQGSGAVETTGEHAGNASSPRPPSLSTFPGGAVLVGDAVSCTVARYAPTSDSTVWSFVIPQCGVLETAIALDSVAYVRTRKALVAINADGKEMWRVTLSDTEPLPPDLVAPATTADSRVVLATSVRSVVAYKNDSGEAWRFGFADEVLVSPPVASQGSGVFLITNQALYSLAADGTLRFRRSRTTE